MIPKIIHYCWFGGNELNDLAKMCIESWKKYCPDYEIIEWNESNFDVNSNIYTKQAYEAKKYAFLTDYVRLYAMYEYGGIYMDTDVELLKPIDSFLENTAFSGFENDSQIMTAFMGAEKGNEWIGYLKSYYNDKEFILPDGSYELVTNVVTITNMAIAKYDIRLDNTYQKIDNLLTLYPRDFFCPKDYVTGEIHLTENTVCIHHFNASWHPDIKKDRRRLNEVYSKKINDSHGIKKKILKKFAPEIIEHKLTLKYDGVFKMLKGVLSSLRSYFVRIIRRIYLKFTPIKVVAFESLNGLDGNTGALYRYMLSEKKYKNYRYVWLIRDKKPYHKSDNKNTYIFDFYDSSFKKRLLVSAAQYLIFDNVPIVKKSSEQKSIYLSHGCPIMKKVKGIINVPDYVDMALCTSENVKDEFCNQISFDKNKIFISGLPRNDDMVSDKNELAKLTDKEFSKAIIWMPTFRKLKYDSSRNDTSKMLQLGIPLLQTDDEINELNRILAEKNVILIIKLHPGEDDSKVTIESKSNIMLVNDDVLKEADVNLYSLLGSTDALMTDYSSVAFDYMLLDKPLGYVIDDIDDYKLGFVYDDPYSMMPGKKIKQFSDLSDFIDDIATGKDEFKSERRSVNDFGNQYHDFENCRRTAEIIFG